MNSLKDEINSTMINVISNVLENMAFMEAIESSELRKPKNIPDLMCCSILVNDPVFGEFKLFMSKDLLIKITEAIYGFLDEELSEQVFLNDTLAEILNTIVGKFFKEVLPPEQPFSLGLPEIGSTEECPKKDPGSIEWNFTLENDPVLLISSEQILKTLAEFNTAKRN